jgi:hypothetical protein
MKHQRKKNKTYDEFEGYYTMPCTREPFEGEVIKLDGQSFNILFQNYSDGDEFKFREKLENMDEWLSNKPYKITANWLNYIVKWLQKHKEIYNK